MWTRDALQPKLALPLASGGAAPLPATGVRPNAGFSQALQQAKAGAQPSGSANTPGAGTPATTARHTIGDGDTLIGVVRQQAQARGLQLNGQQELRLAQQLASANQVRNANLVFPGQTLELSALHAGLQTQQAASVRPQNLAMQTAPAPLGTPQTLGPLGRVQAPAPLGTPRPALALGSSPLAYDVRSPHFTPAASALAPSRSAKLSAGATHPVLEKTMDRAVAKGFIPAAEKAAVYDKILQMANKHRFSPDDFARMTLMESDGMNPRASNQRCHGIIQFCDGPARGAASAGYGANPKAILNLSVHQQLGLVDRYFDDVGLKSQGPAGLEDLYLSVLNPASRAQSQANAPLNIQGQQARALHVGSDHSAPITRQSIRQGLLENASARLGQMLPASLRLQAQRAQQYVDNIRPEPTP
jgi:hypothetical protein